MVKSMIYIKYFDSLFLIIPRKTIPVEINQRLTAWFQKSFAQSYPQASFQKTVY